MKIGIFTQPLFFNYGGILQNYALQRVLCNLGHDAYTINWQPELEYSFSLRHIISFLYRLPVSFLKNDVSRAWNPGISLNTYQDISKNTLAFVNKYIKRTCDIRQKDLRTVVDRYAFDAYVVGSDQVWIPSYYPDAFIPFDCRRDVIKIFYAASSGALSWLDIESIRGKCVNYCKSFKAVSVRETALQAKFMKYSDQKIECVLDPTMLLNSEDYLSVVSHENLRSDYIYSYILDPSTFTSEVLTSTKLLLGKKVVSDIPIVPARSINRNNKNLSIFPPVDDWINGIKDSDLVITDSFHGIVFSILFKRQFIVIGNYLRGIDRFQSILSTLGLSNRIVTCIDDIKSIISSPINYHCVFNLLEDRRLFSYNFIKSALK